MNFKLSLLIATFFCCPVSGQENACNGEECWPNIYQDIWGADQNTNGVPAIKPSDLRSNVTGYVVTNEPLDSGWNANHQIHPEVFIPETKIETYKLVEKMFDNYVLDQSKDEPPLTEKEEKEVDTFIAAIQDLEPMKLARKYVDFVEGSTMTDQEWYDRIYTVWFEIYEFRKATPHRSGFEHVFVGEQRGDKLGGYHFWYKYYLDDTTKTDGKDIDYGGTRYTNTNTAELGVANPDSVTISYTLSVGSDIELKKRIGGHLVGCSPEGLIALGLVAFYSRPEFRNDIVINGARYDVVLFKGDSEGKSINTFWFKFKGFEEEVISSTGNVRIVEALVDPAGVDQGNESVTLKNTDKKRISIEGWAIAGNNDAYFKLVGREELVLGPGDTITIKLGKEAALKNIRGNRSAKITLRDADENVVDIVKYRGYDISPGVSISFPID